MPESREAHLYDYPKYYDLVFGSDWKAEFDFLEQCFERYSDRVCRRLFEPACGTGRLMIKFAQSGYEVAGNDLNSHAVDYCNRRFQRAGFGNAAVVGDMADFSVPRKVDACFNMINSFRHLQTEKQADAHFRCIADALRPGGLYIIGLHLTPTVGDRIEEESWSARRGNLAVNSHMWSKSIDLRTRRETIGMQFDIYTPTKRERIVDEMIYRTYTARQFRALLSRRSELEVIGIHDFVYDINSTVEINAETEDLVFVIRRKKKTG